MALYTHRCQQHGDFAVERSFADTRRHEPCPICQGMSPKVLGANLQFTYGRAAFHSGVEGTGETIRETGERWRAEYKAVHGREPEPVGTRWI